MRHLLLAIALLVGCDEPKKSPPAPAPSPAPTVAAPAPAPSPSPAVSAPASAGASAGATQTDAVPPLVGPDGKPLPQTEDEPSLRSPSYEKRVQLLFRAIQTDDPKVATPAFFPEIAYQQVKAIPNPSADWKNRLIKAFERDIHEAHKQMGNGAMSATLAGLDLPEDKAKWMPPGSEGNKVGYFRVLGSKLRYQDASGGARAIDITSLISWRGEWYVVHVHGFK
ncbi:MAG: hypothetical protein HYV09_20225 [Deltaproteobacteria bacterium]|nr:hypothetical protein [Deltaproteobacteria bacterium]